MYHYTETGLTNVWLANGYQRKKTAYGTAVAIEDADGLHRAIGRAIARQSHLTGSEFRFLRKEMDLSQSGVAKLLGTSDQTVALWERRGKISQTADRMLCAIYLESIEGNVKLMELVARIAERERADNQKLVFQDTDHGWHPKAAA
jgi:DNA-binding transcriptional regulator YiaG